jgi:beta-aspartyl-peptidase (threonine type)
MKNPVALVVHGGSGEMPVELHKARAEGCHHGAEAGWAVLTQGGSALDAVEAATRVLEDDPTSDAGRGSYLNSVGEIEMDAIIMDGRDLNLGAIAAVQRVRHPVTLARLVMTECEHTMLVGPGAEAFAREHGVPVYPTSKLVVERELKRWEAVQAGGDPHELEAFGPSELAEPSDTVGAVALDADGNVAVATSTGGMFNKLPGRVGDSPLIGSGAYADNLAGAASATGQGEELMKIVISKAACDLLAQGMTAQEAADAAIARLAERTPGRGGIIVVDHRGGIGVAHNAPHIAYAYVAPNGEIVSGIRVEKEDTL